MEKHKKYIIFITDQFGYRSGGSNTVNYELCIALRQITMEDVDVSAMVLNCQDKDRIVDLEDRAKNLNVRIIHQSVLHKDKIADAECDEICNRIFDDQQQFKNSVWIGHDIFTGTQAIKLASYSKGISVVCIHTDYDTIEGLKGRNGNGIIKESKQRNIIMQADKVLAVGPRLMERVREVRKYNVYEIIPGIFKFPESDLSNRRAVITYGRFEGNVAQVKQIQLVLAAFGRAVALMNTNRDYVLHVIGTPDVEEEIRLREIAEKYANGRKLSINFLKYTQDRKKLFSCLMNNCAGLMVSISEGFGLTGWEIISAGIPLIITKKSGLYDYLVKKFGYMVNGMCLPVDLKGSSIDYLCEEDIENVADKIITVLKNVDQMKDAALELRNQVRGDTWHKAAEKLAQAIDVKTIDFGMTDLYSETYKTRKACIEEILNQLEIGDIDYRNLIFFGGISSALCADRAREKLERWLKADKKRRLFICYESGDAAAERAMELDEEKLPHDNLPSNPKARMKVKEKIVLDSLQKYDLSVQDQVRGIKIEKGLMTYAIILDQNVYFTLLLETRSSEMMTMKLKENFTEEKRKIIESINYVIQKKELDNYEKELVEILQKIT